MKIKKTIRYIIDVIMVLAIILLMDTDFTGLFIHEVLGIFLLILFFVHISINKQWIKSIYKTIRNNKEFQKEIKDETKGYISKGIKSRSKVSISQKAKAMIVVDVSLGILIAMLIVISPLISKEVLPLDLEEIYYIPLTIHKISGYGLLVGIVIHLSFHFKMIKAKIRNIFVENRRLIDENTTKAEDKRIIAKKIITIMTVILVVAFSVRAMVSPIVENGLLKQVLGYFGIEITVGKLTDEERRGYRVATDEELEANGLVCYETLEKPPTLNEFLQQMICDECSDCCPLTELKCILGERPYERAVEEYKTTYGDSATEL